MGKQSALRFDPGSDVLGDFLADVQALGRTERGTWNFVMRELSRNASERLVPVVEAAVRSSPVPQAGAVAQTVRGQRDRMIVVTVGAVNPPLSGWKRARGARVNAKGSVAWGVALGGWPSQSQQVKAHSVKGHAVSSYTRRGGMVSGYRRKRFQVQGYRRSQGNVYQRGRAGSPGDPFGGYMSGWKERIVEQAKEEYADIILAIVKRMGWPVGG